MFDNLSQSAVQCGPKNGPNDHDGATPSPTVHAPGAPRETPTCLTERSPAAGLDAKRKIGGRDAAVDAQCILLDGATRAAPSLRDQGAWMTTLKEKLQEQERELIALRAQVEMLKSIIVEQRAASQAAGHVQPTGIQALPTLTLKQHATLLGVCAHLPWEELADHMGVDRTTVKLHLRALAEKLGKPGALRTEIAAAFAPEIAAIGDEEYKTRYGIHKQWWLPGKEDKETLATLRTKRSMGGHPHR